MRRITGVFCIILAGMAGAAMAESFLEPAYFPKTINDISFVDRIKVAAEGYEPFETEFDENGKCISGCPYHGFTVEDQIAQIKRNEEISRILLEEATRPEPEIGPHPDNNKPPNNQVQPPKTPPKIPPRENTNPPRNNTRKCSVFLAENKIGTQGPLGEPLANCPRILSPYGMRTHPVTGKKNKMHNAVDLSVPNGTSVYATGDGVVIEAVTNENLDACGKYVKIQHPNGMISVYCHLSKILVKQNETIQAGCEIAKSGSTGLVTGPHLHYSVRLSNNQAVDPEKWMPCKHKH